MPRRLSFVLLLLLLRAACAAEPAQGDGAFPALPKGYQLNVGDTSDLVFVEQDDHGGKTRMVDAIYTFWDTSTGERRKLAMPTDFYADKAAPALQGALVLIGTKAEGSATDHAPGLIAFVDPNGRPAVGALPVTRHIPKLVVLADQSALVYSGYTGFTGPRLKTVERAVLKNGRVAVERMPDLPGMASNYALVALKDGRALLVGGSDSKYAGMCPCSADTWLFDPKTKSWSKGPRLLEPRADPSATVLPNGDVLVAGGWTPGHGWNEGASRTTERWKPGTPNFVADAPLPAGVALHDAIWAAGSKGRDLLIVGGMARAWEGSSAVMDLDTSTGIWRTVGEGCSANKPENRVRAASAVSGTVPYMWCSVDMTDPPLRFALRLPSGGPVRIPQPDGLALRRKDMGFLPAQGDAPALAVGGKANEVATGDVDAIWPDGRIESLPPLRAARTGAAVIALAGGSRLVVGGGAAQEQGAELLAAGASALKQPARVLPFELSDEDSVGQAADGKLLALRRDGRVETIALAKPKGAPALERSSLPPLEHRRRSGKAGKAVIKGLPDGRIIVAGGEQLPYTIAVLQEDAMKPDAPDKYVGAGLFEPAHDYDIYDPARRAWRASAPSRSAGGTVAVLDDGRVVKLGEGMIDTSTVAGDAWRPFEKKGLLVHPDEQARLFAAQGELFLSGVASGQPSSEVPTMLQWYDGARHEWTTLWQADPHSNWRDHVGRVLVRTLANGKHVVIPVEGF